MNKIACLIIAAAAYGCCRATAQDISAQLTAEMQADAGGHTNMSSLLRIDFMQPLCKGVRLNMAVISIARTRDGGIDCSRQGFSNIDEDNTTLAPAVAGLTFTSGGSMLFAGIRNMNEDYFTSHFMSLFTNSSCGIFPTISANYRIANYPLASMGIHLERKIRELTVMASVYNGVGYKSFSGRQNVFRICPESDGLFSILSVNYQNNGSTFNIGANLHYGNNVPYEELAGTATAEKAQKTQKKTATGAVWGYAELMIAPRMCAIMQYSANPSKSVICRRYAGIGLVRTMRNAELGVFADRAVYKDETEWAAELTCRINCLGRGYLQPAIHLIKNSDGAYCAGLLRMSYTI